MVYYRKYRPQKISELDSREVREKLFSIFPASPAGGSKDSPHAFLLTGSKGLGKTSTARIIAKVVNCEKRSKIKDQKSKIKNQKLENQEPITNNQIEPCNDCTQCRSITNGTNLDVLEIDGASNRGIDEIRDLREKIRLVPLASRKKVYIIDEVHMLTTEAFNALLKTLEEPPNHAIFILCTTELHKVPETILSRCFHVPFRRATEEELVSSFKRIVEGENLKIDNEVLAHIAKLSEGSFRDGAKILEELTFLSEGKLMTKGFLEEKYQISNIKYQISKMTIFLLENDTKSALQLVSELTKQGVDIRYFIEQMINILHDELLVKVGVKQDSRFNPPAGGQSSKFTIEEIKKLVELLTRAHGELKHAVLPQLPLELVILDYSVRGAVISVSSPRFNQDNLWIKMIENVKKYNHSIAGVLRSCSLGEVSDKELIIKAGYKFHKDKLEEKKALEILEKAWEELAGKKVKIVIELRE